MNGVPLGTFLSIDGKELYVSENNKSVEVICTKTDKIIRRLNFYDVPVACMGGPDGNLYIGFANGFLGVYDSENGETIREPIFTGGTLPAWYTFSSDRNKLYVDVVCSIGVIDIKEWKLIKSISTKNNREDDSWAFTSTLSPNGDKLYVTLLGDKGVLVIDTKTDTIISEIETAGSATCVTFSSDGRYGYISDMGPSLSYLKGPSGGTILGTAWVGFGIIGNGQIIIFDPISDKIIGEPISVGPTPGITVCLPSID
ncbi:YncE family protein [Aquimarina sp. TRL1]|nr:YncE family protein [Aquimarina sp. TRL1]